MTRIAVLSDIHGNTFALEAVITDIGKMSVDRVVVAGDLVGRGPAGSAVVRRIADLGWPCIRGNHEDYLLGFVRRRVPEDWWHLPEWSASRWMAAELDTEAVDFIEALPGGLTIDAAVPLRIVHGSPKSHTDGLGQWTSDEKLEAHLASIQESHLVCAHTHRPMARRVNTGTVTNVGATGLPFNGDWRAQYAIFDDTSGEWEPEFRQVPYDRAGFIQHYSTSGFLVDGGVTATLLLREVQDARSQLVPFLKWAEAFGLEPDPKHFQRFYKIFDPLAPMSDFGAYLQRHAPDPSKAWT